MSTSDLAWWDGLRHGGLLLDARRLGELVTESPPDLYEFHQRELRKRIGALRNDTADASEFVGFVLESLCGFSGAGGSWLRGSSVPAEYSRRGAAGEAIKPRHLWKGPHGAFLPVFIDKEQRVGIGRGRRAVSAALQWLRSGTEQLALVTNGRQWRLIFAGIDFEAWSEWDTDLWFEEGTPSGQVTGLRSLFTPALWTPPEAGSPSPLLKAVLDSRKGQAELSQVLGERVREAVETLVQGHGEALKDLARNTDAAEIYRAAARMVMRMVVVFFAESRDLLPRDNTVYHASYGLNGLREQLERIHARGGNRLGRQYTAWPRVLSLFRLISEGSHHPDLPVPAYGGELFAAGDPQSKDGLLRAVHVFESACYDLELMSDREVHRILELITRTKVKIRQGRATTWMPAPVDFSDLSSEYIGILYEGLLDFELRTAPSDDSVIFLAVGDQPALPLARLEAMDEKGIKTLLEKLKDKTKGGDEEEAESDAEEADDADEPEDDETETDAEEAATNDEPENEAADGDGRLTTRTRAERWARRAVEVGSLVKKPRGTLTPEKRLRFENLVGRKARQLVARVVLPGEWYLVRWGGTRKGSGTFYTRPQLSVPTVHRTLRPLAFDPPMGPDGQLNIDALTAQWAPKKPEQILALKVCDPACGSGSFPVAALRFLTDALFVSILHHKRIDPDKGRPLAEILGLPSHSKDDTGSEERLPVGLDHDAFEPKTKAVLRRYVVERCIYGVDLDPLAVELCRLALWIETMDRELPFSFLDHKFKCGNALVGCWFDHFRHYPIMAWLREGGDRGHITGVHFAKEARTKAIAKHLKDVIKPDLVAMIDRMRGQGDLFTAEGKTAEQVHDEALTILEQMHRLGPGEDGEHQRATLHRQLRESPAYVALRRAFDCWCALWFWPADQLAAAPKPSTFTALSPEAIEVAERIARERRFFHWELEFPDVFAAMAAGVAQNAAAPGFDAVLGNPPWDTLQPNSKEWFSNVDPLFRTYGKQDAIAKQKAYFAASENVEREWLEFIAFFKDTANFVKAGASPFGDQITTDDEGKQTHDFPLGGRGRASLESSKARHSAWAKRRAFDVGYADPEHPYALQGDGKPYTYKLFTELALALLKTDGRLGFVVPSGLYTDHGSTELRARLLGKCRWEWLFGFENRDGIFDIHRSFKFNPVLIVKGGQTAVIRTAFMQRDPDDWALGVAEALAVPYARAQVERFSPRSKAILEIRSARDLAVLEKIYANSVLLGDSGPEGWGIRYAQGDFNMTSDSALFPPRPKWEERGYRPDEYSRWIKGDWRPIGELWADMGVPSGTARGVGSSADAPFHNAPPYQSLPVPRADLPPGMILSRDITAFIREEAIDWEVEMVEDEDGNEVEVRHRAVALPLYQGVMVGLMCANRAAYLAGAGNRVRWDSSDSPVLEYSTQFLISQHDAEQMAPSSTAPRYLLRNIARTTDARTVIGSPSPRFAAGHSLAAISVAGDNFSGAGALGAVLSSISFDWQFRQRLGGTNLSFAFFIDAAAAKAGVQLAAISLRLSNPGLTLADAWLVPGSSPCSAQRSSWRSLWALSPQERLRLRCILDAAVAALYSLDLDDLKWILKDCDHPAAEVTNKAFARRLDPKGFWRVDKHESPERRHTVLTIVAFADLSALIAAVTAAGATRDDAIAAFCGQPTKPLPHVDGLLGSIDASGGWMLPENFRLADLGLGHDDRAEQPQPVASALGPRFYDWQLTQDPAESWRECALHARNLLGAEGFERLQAELEGRAPTVEPAPGMQRDTKAAKTIQEGLFG